MSKIVNIEGYGIYWKDGKWYCKNCDKHLSYLWVVDTGTVIVRSTAEYNKEIGKIVEEVLDSDYETHARECFECPHCEYMIGLYKDKVYEMILKGEDKL